MGGEAIANGVHFARGGTFTGEPRKLRGDFFFDCGDGGARDDGDVRVVDGSVLKRDLIDAGGLRELIGYDFVEVVRAVVVGPDRFREVECDRITARRGRADKGEVDALVIEAAGEFDKFWSGERRGGDDGSDAEVGGR